MVKIVSGGSKVGVDSVSIVCVDVGLEGACRAPGRELKLANTHFSRFYYLPDLESQPRGPMLATRADFAAALLERQRQKRAPRRRDQPTH